MKNINTLTSRQRLFLIITPVVVFILIILALTIYTRSRYEPPVPQITVVESPLDYSITEEAQFLIRFDSVIPPHARDNIVIQTLPDVTLETEWQTNDSILVIPFPSLEKGVDYEVSVLYKDTVITSRQFTVNPFSLEELEIQAERQSEDDLEFSNASREIRREYPWYDALPIDTENFVIVYHYDREQFRIRLKISEDSDQVLIDSYINQALNRLGVLSSIPEDFEYYILFQN